MTISVVVAHYTDQCPLTDEISTTYCSEGKKRTNEVKSQEIGEHRSGDLTRSIESVQSLESVESVESVVG